MAILNQVLRPLLARWHPLLLDYESTRPSGISSIEHERRWDQRTQLRHELDVVRGVLVEYADILAAVAGVPSLTAAPTKKPH